MKQYLILLKSTDFNKSDNIWTSNSINLYSNSQYKNYSYTRSSNGLNILGDRTFVGTEITSPSYGDSEAYSDTAIYKTDYGEIVYEPATPSLLRFVDTTSRVDVLSYRHIFTNIPGTAYPSFNLQIYESDSENGPWLKSVFSSDSNTIFLRNCKTFIKLELEIFADGIDLNSLGLVFYLEVGIHDPVSNVISTSTKNILKRFPSWTKLFEDGQDDATPETATPDTVGGKFLNALVQESLDTFRTKIDYKLINSFINTADINQLAWCYVADNIGPNINTIFGDGIELARSSSLNNFFASRVDDFIFYYNPIDRQLLTVKNFNILEVNQTNVSLEPLNIFNDFDEFGARLGLPRLYLESNDNYRKRILDVSINQSSSSLEGFKRTIRRELDLWRAYGSTPDSTFSGATPFVLEISDLESATPYVDVYGNPTKLFRTFVDDINAKYPSNLGYVNWNETVWDVGGVEEEGLGRLNAKYDYDATPGSQVYQNGVGDLGDFRFEILPSDSSTVNFTGMAHISGVKKTGTVQYYPPIIVDYNSYSTYIRIVSDYENTKADTGFVYEVDLPPHNNYSTPSTFYANINYNNFEELSVGNRFLNTNSASPEFYLFKVFDQEGFSVIQFKDKEFDSEYLNTDSTPNSSKINVHNADEIRVVFSKTWDQANQQYDTLSVDDYRFTYNMATPEWVSSPVEGATVSMSSPNISWFNSSVKVGSNIYAAKEQIFDTKIAVSDNLVRPQSGRIILNQENNPSLTSGATINTSDLTNLHLLPIDATPLNIYIDVKSPALYPLYNMSENATPAGGVSYDVENDQTWLIASSPNILWQKFDSGNSPIGSQDYFDHATINYSSTPSYIYIESDNKPGYPFTKTVFEKFNSNTTPDFFAGYIDQDNNTYRSDESSANAFFNQDPLLGSFELGRDSFNLDSSDYIINSVTFSATPNSIIINSDLSDSGLAAELNSKFNINNVHNANIFARKDNFSDGIYYIGVGSGWLFLGDKEYYHYVDPFTDSATGQYFELELTDTPRAGAPIIVEVDGKELRNVVFEDSTTPGGISFFNTETVKPAYDGSLNLAYSDVSNISVTDSYTGQILFENLSSNSSMFNPFNLSTPHVYDRQYDVAYYVNNAYFIDKDIYNVNTDAFSSKVYFSSTPNTSATPAYIYNITYEKSDLNKSVSVDLDINQISNPLDEGFVYISKEEYNFSTIKTYLSPKYISDNEKDYMALSIVSYDVNGNLKPGQTFEISGEHISATPVYVTTNQNGLGTSIVRYSGVVPSTVKTSSIDIVGIGSSTPNGGPNSSNPGFARSLSFDILNRLRSRLDIKAVPARYNIDADQLTSNTIVGKIYWQGRALEAVVNIKWAKARTLYDLFEETGTYEFGSIVQSDSLGEFEIVDEIISESEIQPGYWFAKVEIENSSQIETILNNLNEIIDLNEITITGDVVYWHEEFDNVHFTNEYTPLPNTFTFEKQIDSDLISTPNFVYRHSDQMVVYNTESTPNWIPPRWVPISRFEQYQMGLFGSTPYYVSDNSLIHPDSKED